MSAAGSPESRAVAKHDGWADMPQSGSGRRPGRFRSIQASFLALTLSSLFVILVAFFVWLDISQYRSDARQIDDKLTRMVEAGSIFLAEATATRNTERILLLLAPVVGDPDIVSIAIELPDGRQLAAFGEPLSEAPEDMMRRRPIMNIVDGEPTQIATLLIAVTHRRIDLAQHERLIEHLILALLIFTAVVLSSHQSLRLTVMRPLRRLLASIQSWHAGGRPPPVIWTRNDEFGELITAFNEMQAGQQRFQRDLRSALDRAEAADRAKTAFLAIISHELKTPLNAIIGFSELLMTLGRSGIADRADYIGHINSSGRKLLDLVNDILEITHAYAGQANIVDEPFPLHEAVSAAIATCREDSPAELVPIENRVPETLPTLVADRGCVTRMLVHLISNAMRFTPADGKVTVEAEILDGELHVRVADTGSGIRADRLIEIQQPFTHDTLEWQNHSEGAGLGLSYANSGLRRHGGRFVLESEPGEGTTATLIFPASRLTAPPAALNAG